MSCTEAEAKTRWCPFYRVATSGGDESTYEIDNRSTVHENTTPDEQNPRKQKWVDTGRPIPQSCCVASSCMAWQWSSPNPEVKIGFCGLASHTGYSR